MPSDNSQIKQHQRYARTGGDPQAGGDFGCQSLASTARSTGNPSMGSGKTLKDGARTPPVPHSRGMGQGNTDHGAY